MFAVFFPSSDNCKTRFVPKFGARCTISRAAGFDLDFGLDVDAGVAPSAALPHPQWTNITVAQTSIAEVERRNCMLASIVTSRTYPEQSRTIPADPFSFLLL